jgi:hypothetical protein
LESEGLDTAKLGKVKVGIHSGDITVEILCRMKSRFEMFGDMINTESRMDEEEHQ